MVSEATLLRRRNIAKVASTLPKGMGCDAKGPFKWRTSKQIGGVEGTLQRAINLCDNGAEITLDITTAHNLLEIARQAKHTERGHES